MSKSTWRRLAMAFLALLLGSGWVLGFIEGLASARESVELSPATSPASDGEVRATQHLTYAKVITADVPVYAHPSDMNGAGPVRSLGWGYIWISLADEQPYYQAGQAWYRINDHEYVQAEYLEIYFPSRFQGVALPAQPDHPFAWMVYGASVSPEPGQAPLKEARFLPRYTLVTIYEEERVGDWIWYRVGEKQWLEQRTVGVVKATPRPEGVGPTERWIEVNLYEQTLAAYEGEQLVYATLISSGLPWWQTKQGLFRIWTKVKQAKMSGRDGYPDAYFLEDVPFAMYFHRSFALHGTYWHDRFGFPHSRGCVNVALKDAAWLFDWVTPTTGPSNWTMATAEHPGTWVWIHD